MGATTLSPRAIAFDPIPAARARSWRRAGETLCCVAVMTAGLGVDRLSGRYASLDLCSSDLSPSQMLVIHVTLLPASCIAMYAATLLALIAAAPDDGGLRRLGRTLACAALDTAQVAAGALMMATPPFALVGGGYARAWLAMAAAMAVAHVRRCGVRQYQEQRRGNGNEAR